MSNNFDFINFLDESVYFYARHTQMNDYIVDLQGWKSSNFDANFTNLSTDINNNFQEPLKICEIGTWKGLTSTTMANILNSNNIESKIICVDTWLGSPEYLTNGINNTNQGEMLYKRGIGFPTVYYTFVNNVCKLQLTNTIIPFPMSSIEASNVLDFYNIKFHIIFMDCYYDYISVKTNLNSYWKLLKNNGYIFGDYYNITSIKDAIDEFALTNNLVLIINENFWVLKK